MTSPPLSPVATTSAVILARGLGMRMRKPDNSAELARDQAAVADAGIKGMISIGRPFLDFVLSGLADAGFTRVCLVIGPEHRIVRDYYEGKGKPSRITVEIAIQEKPLGTADAVLAAEKFTAGEPFVVLNSDNYYPASALRKIRLASAPAVAGFRRKTLVENGNVSADRVWKFGAIETDSDGFLSRITVGEAAKVPNDEALASMNCWLFDDRIFEACRRVPPSSRGEYELPQAVKLGIEDLGMRIHVVPVEAAVLDLSSRSDVASVAHRLESIDISL